MEHIQAKYYQPANRRPEDIPWLVLHCMQIDEKPDTAEGCARYFQNPSYPASAHVTVDSNSEVSCVLERDIAYGAKHANTKGKHYELAGFAQQSAAEWLDPYSSATILRTAKLFADDIKRGVAQYAWCGATQLQAGIRGITDHATVEAAFPSTGHYDPGPHFPREWFMQEVGVNLGHIKRQEIDMGARQIPGTGLLPNGRAIFLDVEPDGHVLVYNDVSALNGAQSIYFKGDMHVNKYKQPAVIPHAGIIGWEFLVNSTGAYYGYILYAADGGTFIFK